MALNEQISDSKASRTHRPALCSPRRGGSSPNTQLANSSLDPASQPHTLLASALNGSPSLPKLLGKSSTGRGGGTGGGDGMEWNFSLTILWWGMGGGDRRTACGLQQRYGPGTTLLVKVRGLVSHSPGLQVGMLPEHNQLRVVTAQETRSCSCEWKAHTFFT